jgi:hypothetical protein
MRRRTYTDFPVPDHPNPAAHLAFPGRARRSPAGLALRVMVSTGTAFHENHCMRQGFRWVVGLAVGAAFAAFAPLYPRHVMTRKFRESGGDLVTWAWKRVSLPDFVENMHYMGPEQKPRLWLWINIGLAALFAAVLAALVVLLWGVLSRRKVRAGSP